MTQLERQPLAGALVVAFCFLIGPAARADTFTLFNTGVGPTNALLGGGAADSHWTIVAGPGVIVAAPARVLTNQSQSGVYAQDADARWVWVNAAGAAGVTAPYTFRTTFDLTGINPATATIAGRWAVDNFGEIRLNGAPAVGTGSLSLPDGNIIANFSGFHEFTINAGFIIGVNTLDFAAVDLLNPAGLNVTDLSGTAAPVPEPSAIILLGFGSACAAGRRGRRGIQSRP